MIRQLFFSGADHGSFSDRLSACLDLVGNKAAASNILGIVLFVDTVSDSDYFRKKDEVLAELHSRQMNFPCNVQAQAHRDMVSVEIWMDDNALRIEHCRLDGVSYTRTVSSDGTALWGFGLTHPIPGTPLADQIDYSLMVAVRILATEGLSLRDVVRQWNYVPAILELKEEEGKQLQHYQVFNEIRQKYYSACSFDRGYPAATGIGTRHGAFGLDFFALKADTDVTSRPVANPKQENAYGYAQQYLVGDSLSGQPKKTPLFERARLLSNRHQTTLFLSGTASIIGQETIGVGDVRRQTEVTLDNLRQLIATAGLEGQGHYSYLRAYVREDRDVDTVRQICDEQLPGCPVSFLTADVCRDNLLVEIEGQYSIPS